MTTHGMCLICRFNIAAPGDDLCRDCLDLSAEQKRRRRELAERQCPHRVPWCGPLNACNDCSEMAYYGSVRVWDDAA